MAAPSVAQKRRARRRKEDKTPVATRLVLPDHVKGDVGYISDDLFKELFPRCHADPADNEDDAEPTIFHIAITPWTPNSSAADTPWAIVPVIRSTDTSASTIQFSPSSSALQTFAKTLQKVAPSKLSSHIRSGIDILALDVVALELDTVYVKLESELTKRLENGEDPPVRARLPGHTLAQHQDHPEPGQDTCAEARPPRDSSSRSLGDVREDDEEDTGNEFYSAAEERYKTDAQTDGFVSVTEAEPPLSHPLTPAGSTMQPGTPTTVGRGRRTNGISTPGSVFSNFTATTARPDRQRGRLFKTHGLMAPISDDLLHPKPAPEDDEEARVYVDISSLQDWLLLRRLGVQLASRQGIQPPESHSRRPMTRIPSSQRPGDRRPSFFDSQIQKPTSPSAYVSPILQANLDGASFVRISAIKRGSYHGKGTLPKFTNASRPPDARDIRIHQVKSPVTTERAYQTAVLGGIKRYFARKIRLLRTGDLLAIPVDTRLGRAMQESATGTEVDYIRVSGADDSEHNDAEDLWGSVASVDSLSVMLNVSGFETSRVPGTKDSNWQYYLGLKKAAKPLPDAPSASSLPEPEVRYVSPVRRQLRELIATATSQRAIHLKMPPVAILLVSTHRDIGKATVAEEACADIGIHSYAIDCYDILSESGGSGGDVKTEAYLTTRADRAIGCGPDCCALLVRHIETLTAERIATSLKEVLQSVRVLIATTSEVDKIPDTIRGMFTHELEMRAPDEGEREGILRSVINDRGVSIDPAVDLGNIALKTAALVAGDLVDVVDRAEDFDAAVDAVRKNFSDAIGAPKIPSVTWDDVGGLNNVKDAITETIQLPLERPELFAKGMKKRLNFLSVKGPELLNMYIGESEANVRRVFQRARDARPCVVFFDELDSVAPKRGNQGDSGGVMDRIVSQLLAELDGMSGGDDDAGGVFVIGATNRPDLLDQALLRPGRFDKLLYLGVSDTRDKQTTILEALTRKFALHPSVSLSNVASQLPYTYTGADFYALCSDAMLKAVTRQALHVDTRVAAANAEDLAVQVTEADFLEAQRELVPSVSAGELAHYERVRKSFEGERAPGEAKGKGKAEDKGKGKGKAVATDGDEDQYGGSGKGKGKGKAVAGPGFLRDGEDGAGENGNGVSDGPEEFGRVNGRSKGKGKAVAGFQEGTASDDDGLY
ncbi:unnamed protein product [Parascedosporium putredinis]|uniref:AAA+ ATPase domain-containing protein n=1 Tax=Parascedosporium putredinis TaxID=1442378 RepID=A0A9P1GZD4_9PEZI|nr:unnamed protein product [Parascedosporium putredinis]CAI7992796.1 unnamed protein product [Parascedosporium putredinis]